ARRQVSGAKRSRTRHYVREPQDRIVGRNPATVGPAGPTVYRYQVIFRNNLEYGNLLGPNGEFYAPKLQLLGDKLDTAWSHLPGSYQLFRRTMRTTRNLVSP
ncbi:MAG TPA: hypothetical protein VEQ63_08950, partial [Bryobacteraceae bacterium]|nr:hypothetical protein [Bryobacteraceae bacterium]